MKRLSIIFLAMFITLIFGVTPVSAYTNNYSAYRAEKQRNYDNYQRQKEQSYKNNRNKSYSERRAEYERIYQENRKVYEDTYNKYHNGSSGSSSASSSYDSYGSTYIGDTDIININAWIYGRWNQVDGNGECIIGASGVCTYNDFIYNHGSCNVSGSTAMYSGYTVDESTNAIKAIAITANDMKNGQAVFTVVESTAVNGVLTAGTPVTLTMAKKQ